MTDASRKYCRVSSRSRLRRTDSERIRTDEMNQAYTRLQRCVPHVPFDEKLPKIKTLRLAVRYIKHLQNVLRGDELFRSPFSDKLRPLEIEDFASVAMAEMQAKNNYGDRVDRATRQNSPDDETPHGSLQQSADCGGNGYRSRFQHHSSIRQQRACPNLPVRQFPAWQNCPVVQQQAWRNDPAKQLQQQMWTNATPATRLQQQMWRDDPVRQPQQQTWRNDLAGQQLQDWRIDSVVELTGCVRVRDQTTESNSQFDTSARVEAIEYNSLTN